MSFAGTGLSDLYRQLNVDHSTIFRQIIDIPSELTPQTIAKKTLSVALMNRPNFFPKGHLEEKATLFVGKLSFCKAYNHQGSLEVDKFSLTTSLVNQISHTLTKIMHTSLPADQTLMNKEGTSQEYLIAYSLDCALWNRLRMIVEEAEKLLIIESIKSAKAWTEKIFSSFDTILESDWTGELKDFKERSERELKRDLGYRFIEINRIGVLLLKALADDANEIYPSPHFLSLDWKNKTTHLLNACNSMEEVFREEQKNDLKSIRELFYLEKLQFISTKIKELDSLASLQAEKSAPQVDLSDLFEERKEEARSLSKKLGRRKTLHEVFINRTNLRKYNESYGEISSSTPSLENISLVRFSDKFSLELFLLIFKAYRSESSFFKKKKTKIMEVIEFITVLPNLKNEGEKDVFLGAVKKIEEKVKEMERCFDPEQIKFSAYFLRALFNKVLVSFELDPS